MPQTQNNLTPIHGRRSSIRGRVRNGIHFADFAPKGLPWLWTHAVVNARHFIKDYNLAVGLTVAFLVLVIAASFIRVSQRSSLANLLATVTTVTQGYGSLTSADKVDTPERGDTSDEPDEAIAPTGTPTSTTFNSGSSNPAQQPASGGGNTVTPPPAAPFAAAIAAFQQDSVRLECSIPNPNKPNCGKRYVFSANVSTQNGPGTVSYGWRSNIAGANSDGSYSASGSSGSQSLQKSVTIDCLSPGSYNMQFVILSPSQVQSKTISINHNCNGI